MRRLLLALAFVLALGGCGIFDIASTAPAPNTASSSGTENAGNVSSAEELVAYLARLKSLNETALNAETSRQRQTLQRDSSDLARVKAAMASIFVHRD